MTFNQEELSDVDYLCGMELHSGPSSDSYYHHLNDNSNNNGHNSTYQNLTCSEVLPSPEVVDLLPQSSLLPNASASMAMNTLLTSTGPSLCPISSPSSLVPAPPSGASAICTDGRQGQFRPTLHVEVCQRAESTLRCSRLKELVLSMLRQRGTAFGELFLQEFEDPVMKEHIQSVSISDVPCQLKLLDFRYLPLVLHVFRLHLEGPQAEELEEGEDTAYSNWTLPAVDFHGLWDNLIFSVDIKQNLLSYAETTLLFSDRGVNPLLISWNRVVLLHGPPGTGKTSLCKALAQKLSVRLSHRYSYGHLVEINSHSLFSKWFSESGKLVQKMFKKVQDMISDPTSLVCVLIDEVESLTSARSSAFRGSEPSDAIRVVNALLTQLDQIRRYPNVLILTTSNVSEAIDIAFIDRADIKQYIGMPSVDAIYKIYHSCIKELIRVNIISPSYQLLDLRTLEVMRFLENDTTRLSLELRHIARQSEGLSGRALRKLPFLAHTLLSMELQEMSSMSQFLSSLERAVLKQIAERNDLTSMSGN